MGLGGLGFRLAPFGRRWLLPWCLSVLAPLTATCQEQRLAPGSSSRIHKLPPVATGMDAGRLIRLPSTATPSSLGTLSVAPPNRAAVADHVSVPAVAVIPAPPTPEERRLAMIANHRFDVPMSAYADDAERSAAVSVPTLEELKSVQMPIDVERRARGLLVEAEALANRGALFAAHEEFLRVMRMLTQALDADLGRPFHAAALSAGLNALDEAESFSLAGKRVEADIHLAGFIAGHRTPVLKGIDPLTLTPLLAMQRYYDYAYKQLTLAGNDEPIASEALFALGRIETLIAGEHAESSSGGPKAIALFQAALSVDGRNSRAANELGVLLARCGRLPEARDVFAHAVRHAPILMAQRNLAEMERQLASSGPVASPPLPQPEASAAAIASRVQWVDPGAFNQIPDQGGAVPPGTPWMGSGMPQTPTAGPLAVPSRMVAPTPASVSQPFQPWFGP